LYTILHKKAIHTYTKFQQHIQNHTTLFKIVHNTTQLYRHMHKYITNTKLYNFFFFYQKRKNKLYKNREQLFKHIQKYTKIQQLYNTFQKSVHIFFSQNYSNIYKIKQKYKPQQHYFQNCTQFYKIAQTYTNFWHNLLYNIFYNKNVHNSTKLYNNLENFTTQHT